MKATIDFDEGLYRRLKIEAARRGRTVRELVAEGVRCVLEAPSRSPRRAAADHRDAAPWFAALKHYASNARGSHDLAALRQSIARGRRRASK